MLVSIPFFHNSWNSEGIIGLKYFKTIDNFFVKPVDEYGEEVIEDDENITDNQAMTQLKSLEKDIVRTAIIKEKKRYLNH